MFPFSNLFRPGPGLFTKDGIHHILKRLKLPVKPLTNHAISVDLLDWESNLSKSQDDSSKIERFPFPLRQIPFCQHFNLSFYQNVTSLLMIYQWFLTRVPGTPCFPWRTSRAVHNTKSKGRELKCKKERKNMKKGVYQRLAV